jgi:hypothetical protein
VTASGDPVGEEKSSSLPRPKSPRICGSVNSLDGFGLTMQRIWDLQPQSKKTVLPPAYSWEGPGATLYKPG